MNIIALTRLKQYILLNTLICIGYYLFVMNVLEIVPNKVDNLL